MWTCRVPTGQDEKPYRKPYQTIPDHAVFITPPPSINGNGGQSAAQRPTINRPPPKHAGVNIPGVAYPPNSGNIQDIISHHNSDTLESQRRNDRTKASNRLYDQNFRPPIKDLTDPPPIIIGKTTIRPNSFKNQNYGGIENPYRSKPSVDNQQNIFDTHNRLQPIILEDAYSQNKGDDRKHENMKNTNRRIDINQNVYNNRAPHQPSNAIDPNDYKFYSFVTDSPKSITTRRPLHTTTARPLPYSPTRPASIYTTRRPEYINEYASPPRPTTPAANTYDPAYNSDR